MTATYHGEPLRFNGIRLDEVSARDLLDCLCAIHRQYHNAVPSEQEVLDGAYGRAFDAQAAELRSRTLHQVRSDSVTDMPTAELRVLVNRAWLTLSEMRWAKPEVEDLIADVIARGERELARRAR